MAVFSSKGVVVISVPILVLSVAAAAILLFLLLSATFSSSPTCSCPPPTSGIGQSQRISPSPEDLRWVKAQIDANGLHMHQNVLRKGINPRTRQQQLQDLLHSVLPLGLYVSPFRQAGLDDMTQSRFLLFVQVQDADNHTALPCPGELLVEEHHSNYGEPWAGGRDVFEFLAESIHLTPNSQVLEIGCGTLRVGLHFIRYLNPGHYHCLERDELSLMAALRYELPSQGLLSKRPLIVRGDDMHFSRFGDDAKYNLTYASAVFLHMPDKLVWIGLEQLVSRLKPLEGRIFVSHNIKFCSRLGGEECTKRLNDLGIEFLRKRIHDSLLFNHYEIWFEFRRFKA
ncbi:hypothetical protein ACJIZ3_001405 [Penstemon smallii]|uniref:S-adenosyl-L-methionine-dependent methyltransferase n=1 Tax=Penstemon smallii TaxID=265156 RepID=A0ABD3U4L4_9LAMI